MQNKKKKHKVQSPIDSDEGDTQDDEDAPENVETADGKDGETADEEDGETTGGQADGSDEAAELSQDDNDSDYTPPKNQKIQTKKQN